MDAKVAKLLLSDFSFLHIYPIVFLHSFSEKKIECCMEISGLS